MKITFVMPFVGTEGGVRVCAIYADRLSRRGHEVRVLSCQRTPAPLRQRIRRLARRALGKREPAPAPHPSHLDDLPHLHTKLPRPGPIPASDVPDADVVIATWWETAEWIDRYPASKGAKVHFIQHDERVMYTDPARQERVGRTWHLLNFSRATVAEWITRVGREEYGAVTQTIPNAVDQEVFTAPPRERNTPPTVGMMFSPPAFKGSETGIEAVRRALKEVPNLRFSLFSSYPRLHDLELPKEAAWLHKPSPTELTDYYRSLDAFLFPSRSEGFGLPILEAMACRTPVIGFPTGAAPELIGQGGGCLVPMGDAQAMANAIVQVTTGPAEKWRQMSEAAFTTAQACDWERATDRFEQFLVRAAQSRQGR
jgi:glycosyltransferase involved in cell wall biosynthesis